MITELEQECETIGMELKNIINDNLSLDFEEEFSKSFGYKIEFKEDWKTEFKEACLPIENIKIKLLRNKRNCIIFGESSAGKSSLINALLKMDLLKSGFGVTSNCFVEFKPTDEEQGYIEFNGKRRPLDDLKQLNGFHNEMKLPDGTHIDASINKEKSEILKEDFVLIDTPGINQNNEMDRDVQKYAVDADFVILVINSTATINTAIKNFINRFKNLVSKLNLFIVFNYWDIPGSSTEKDILKLRFLNDAKNLLCDVLSCNNMEAKERIFFLSAEEQIMINNDDPAEFNRSLGWEERRDSFIQFQKTLNAKSIESGLHRKLGYLKEFHIQVSKYLYPHEDTTRIIKSEIEQIRNEFGKITDLDEEINPNVEKIFQKTSSTFIEKARKMIEPDELDKETQKSELVSLLKTSINERILKLRNTIKDLIQKKLESNIEFRGKIIKIIENIYFLLYIGDYENSESFLDNILEIKKKITNASSITIAACGFAFSLFATIIKEIKPQFAGFWKPWEVAANQIYPNAYHLLLDLIDEPFKFLWRKDAAPIEEYVESVKDKLSQSYPKFIEEIKQKLKNISEKLDKIDSQMEFENITEKIKHFENKNF